MGGLVFIFYKRYSALDSWLFQNLANSIFTVRNEATITPRVWNVLSVRDESTRFISAWVLRCSFYSKGQCESLEKAERARIDFHAFIMFRR